MSNGRGDNMAKAGKDKELTEQQIKCAELLAKGENKVDIAEIVGINRKTINSWLTWDNFKAEVDRQVSSLKSKVDEKLAMNIEPLMNKLIDIALKSDSDKTSLDAIIYAVNRYVGTPTNRVADVSDSNDKDSKKVEDIDNVLNRYKNIDSNNDTNVIDIEDVIKVAK